MGIQVEFCGEWFTPDPSRSFDIGREGALQIDDNPYLHRRFLAIECIDDMWWLANVGSQLSATVSDSAGALQAWLAPGARLPMVFAETTVLFTAGPTTYELSIVNDTAAFAMSEVGRSETGETTIGPVMLTPSQKQLIVALAEPLLRRDGTSVSSIPSSREAAARLGWEQTKFNRKLDNVCDKLDRRGVRGLRGGVGQLAVNRRARLVEHAVATRLVVPEDLRLLDLLE
ncbi:hypothetical protein SAMN04515671_2688 [Nakamurella panacisegetis]|uniref:FHA domain-containing protein n=1 Tax=Nakamurella panacisegetis TaxID=1090615 RepID=A0A1H0PBA5_9ACTN|nr:hypothetical protein [Nakamurella panacisegetis]SDP01929.1 hypothetical protein SAMN04515671_2688 [Nakamurella panacisegetis]